MPEEKVRPLEFFSLQELAREIRMRLKENDEAYVLGIQRINPKTGKMQFLYASHGDAYQCFGLAELLTDKMDQRAAKAREKEFSFDDEEDDVDEWPEF